MKELVENLKKMETIGVEEQKYHPDYFVEDDNIKLAIDTKERMIGIINMNTSFSYHWFPTSEIEHITVHTQNTETSDSKSEQEIYYAFQVNGKKVKMHTNEGDSFWNHLRNYHCRQKNLNVEEVELTPEQRYELVCESAKKQARILAGYAGYFGEIPEE